VAAQTSNKARTIAIFQELKIRYKLPANLMLFGPKMGLQQTKRSDLLQKSSTPAEIQSEIPEKNPGNQEKDPGNSGSENSTKSSPKNQRIWLSYQTRNSQKSWKYLTNL
jgi:hypothetical protein